MYFLVSAVCVTAAESWRWWRCQLLAAMLGSSWPARCCQLSRRHSSRHTGDTGPRHNQPPAVVTTEPLYTDTRPRDKETRRGSRRWRVVTRLPGRLQEAAEARRLQTTCSGDRRMGGRC